MERIEDCLAFRLGKAYQHVNRLSRQRLAPYDVTPVQFAALMALWERNGQSGAELGERLRLDSATVTGIVDRLQRAAMITREPHPEDRRINRLMLTARGRELEAELTRVMEELNREILAALSPADAPGFLSAVDCLADLDPAADGKETP